MSEDVEALYEHYRFEAGKGQSPLRIDKFLMNLIENATRNKIQKTQEKKIFIRRIKSKILQKELSPPTIEKKW